MERTPEQRKASRRLSGFDGGPARVGDVGDQGSAQLAFAVAIGKRQGVDVRARDRKSQTRRKIRLRLESVDLARKTGEAPSIEAAVGADIEREAVARHPFLEPAQFPLASSHRRPGQGGCGAAGRYEALGLARQPRDPPCRAQVAVRHEGVRRLTRPDGQDAISGNLRICRVIPGRDSPRATAGSPRPMRPAARDPTPARPWGTSQAPPRCGRCR